MALDASIYGMIRPQQPGAGPLEQYAQIAQVKNMMGQGQLQDLQRGELERSIDEEARIRDLFSRGKPTPEALMAVSPKRGLEYQKNLREAEKSDVDLKGAKTKLLREQTAYMRDRLAQVVDQNGYNAWLEEGKRIFGPDVANTAPPQFSPQVQQQLLMDANGLLERLSPKPPAGHTMKPGGGLSPIDPEYLKGKKDIAAAGAPRIDVKVATKTGESLAKPIGEMVQESKNIAASAVDSIDTANRIREALDSGKVVAGPGATFIRSADQIATVLGIGGSDAAQRLQNTRQVIKGLADFTLAARKQLKGQGQVSDFEGKLIERAASGNIEDLTIPEIKTLVEVTDRLARKGYEIHQGNLKTLRDKPDYADLADFYSVPDLPAPYQSKKKIEGKGGGVDPSKLSDEELKRELGL